MPLHAAAPAQIYTFPDVAALSQGLDTYVAKLSEEAIKRHGKFTVAISGGSLPKQLSAVLKHNKSVDFVSLLFTSFLCSIWKGRGV
jgi:6-phosphogluconolactonase